MTGFAGFVPGERHRVSADIIHRWRAVVPVLPEPLGHNHVPYDQKNRDSNRQHHRQPNQMPRFAQNLLHACRPSLHVRRRKSDRLWLLSLRQPAHNFQDGE